MAKAKADLRSLARSYTTMAIQQLAGIAQNGQSESAKVAACEAILNRGWGKPTQPLSGNDEAPLILRIERVIVDPNIAPAAENAVLEGDDQA